MKKLSMGSRLTLWYFVIFLVAEVVFGASMYVIVRKSVFDTADAVLDGQAADLQRFLVHHQNSSPAQLQAEIAEQYKIHGSQDYLQIADADGSLIYRSPLLAEHPLPTVSFEDLDRPAYENRKLGPDRFRFLSRQMEVSEKIYLGRVGHPMQEESKTLSDFRVYSCGLGLLLLLAVSAAGYWVSRRAVSPMDLPRHQ